MKGKSRWLLLCYIDLSFLKYRDSFFLLSIYHYDKFSTVTKFKYQMELIPGEKTASLNKELEIKIHCFSKL